MNMLKVSNINVYYGAIHAIKDVSFEVNEGEIVTLIGANGAGKSTILKTVSSMMRSKTGSVSFMDEEISTVESYKLISKGITHVPEGRRVFSQLTVEENLEMGGYTVKSSEIPRLMEIVFEQFPRLKERRRQVTATLSGGEQQMLAMGRALMAKPKLIMLDEPSMGFAPILVDQIIDIRRLMNRYGTTILLVEQNAHMALAIVDRGYVLETGRIVMSDSARTLLADNSVKKAYLGG